MKSKAFLAGMVVVLLVIPTYSAASNVVDVTQFIFGPVGGENIPFQATEEPLTYKAVLTDFEFAVPFQFISLSITRGGAMIDSLTGPGSFTFSVEKDASYVANVLGVPGQIPGTDQSAGLFNLQITAVPIPGSIMLLGSGMLGLVVLRRRRRTQ